MSEVAFAFVDIETTGLDPEKNDILEVGIVLTDKNLETIAENSWIGWHRHNFPPGNHCNHSKIVAEMHEKNGLWQECASAGFSPPRSMDYHIYSWLKEHASEGTIEMAGSTISFDRSFLVHDLKFTHDWFHYRNVDVSSFKVTFEKFGLPDNPVPGKKAHRAIADCYDTISDYRYYLTYLGLLNGE